MYQNKHDVGTASRGRSDKLVADCVLQGTLGSAYRRHTNFNSIFMNGSSRRLFSKDNLYSPVARQKLMLCIVGGCLSWIINQGCLVSTVLKY